MSAPTGTTSRTGTATRGSSAGRTAQTESRTKATRDASGGGGRARGGATRVGKASRRTGGGRPPRRPGRSRLLRLGDPGRRLGVGFAAVCTLLVVLGGRLVQLQGFDSEHFAARTEQRLLYPTTIPATRGSIVDRDGQPLAYSVAARTIFADPTEVTDRIGTATALATKLKTTVPRLLPLLSKPHTRYVPLARNLSPAEAAEVLALNLGGIGAEDTSQRIYPGHDLAAAVVGYTNDEGGLGGIESKYNGALRGTDGRLEVERGSNGLQIPGGLRQETAAVAGSTVQLTLDQDLQYQLQNGLAAAVQKAKASSGQAVILDAHTGEVLAMATAPTYDAQNPSKSAPENRTNPVVQAPVEPGSANKVVTFSAAVEHKKITPTTPMTVPDSIQVADHVVHDAWYHAPEHWTATGVLAKSSNVGTLMIARDRVGPAQFYDTERKFGIGQRTGIELPGESPGILPAPDTWSGTTFGNLPIGQGLSMTPLQLAGMYQTIANDGVRVQPRIVKAIIGPDGKAVPTSAPQRTTVISPQAARTVRTMLEAVVAKGGTAPKAAIDEYRVAGKTGTAQRPNPACKCYSGGGYWATFAGIAPADKPELVMSVVITEPPGGGEGGSVAAPLFHDVMSYALTARKVPPTGTPVPKLKLSVD
jgi:cell division protein FtsI (penicillin-binding protein 3)